MKKIGILVKEISQNRIKDNLKGTDTFFVLSYAGTSSPDLTNLRQSLKGVNAALFVAKNNVARRALKDCGLDDILKSIAGPCGFVFAKDDPVAAASVVYKFSRDHEQLQLEAGILKDKLLEKKDIETLVKLPSKGILRAQLLITLNSPVSRLAMVLYQALRKFVYCLDQIKQKKELNQ